MSCMLIPKEDALFKTKHKPKVNIQLHWISLFSKSSWIKTTASGSSYDLGVNGEKKVNRNCDIIDKNGHSTFHIGKPGNFNSLREVISITLWHLPWNWLKMRDAAKKSVMAINTSDYIFRACSWNCWTITADIVVETWVKNCTASFYNHSIAMRSYLLKSNFKFNLQKHHFVYVYEEIIKCYLNFITCLYFPIDLIRWNSSHCHLMEQFKSKRSSTEKLDSNINWKTAWPRMILERHLFLRLSLVFT